MKKTVLGIAAALCMISCANTEEKAEESAVVDITSGPVVEMLTTQGKMSIRLYDATPKHRDNFIKLVKEGYYDGVKFHRVIEGFMIQGGDPISKTDTTMANWGTGGPDYTIAAEFRPELTHIKGALAAARLGDTANPMKASSGSQFYIVQDEAGCRHLDGEYTVYGQVIEGIEVVDAIAAVETDAYDHPLVPVVILKASVVEEEVEEPVEAEEAPAQTDSTSVK